MASGSLSVRLLVLVLVLRRSVSPSQSPDPIIWFSLYSSARICWLLAHPFILRRQWETLQPIGDFTAPRLPNEYAAQYPLVLLVLGDFNEILVMTSRHRHLPSDFYPPMTTIYFIWILHWLVYRRKINQRNWPTNEDHHLRMVIIIMILNQYLLMDWQLVNWVLIHIKILDMHQWYTTNAILVLIGQRDILFQWKSFIKQHCRYWMIQMHTT